MMPGNSGPAAAQRLNQVLANLLLHGPVRHLAPLDGVTQLTQRGDGRLLDILLILSRLMREHAHGNVQLLPFWSLGIEHCALCLSFGGPAARASSRIAAAARSVPKTRLRRSTSAWPPAPTAWNSTCASRPTALPSSVTTRRSIARRMRPDRSSARTAAELSRVDAGYRFTDDVGGHPFRGQGVDIPTLREVLERYPNDSDHRGDEGRHRGDGTRAGGRGPRAGAVDRVCAAGYGSRSLAAAREALPAMASSASRMEVRLALYRSWAGWPPMHPSYGGYQVPEHAGSLRIVSPRFIRHAHRAGLDVQVWTIDEAGTCSGCWRGAPTP